MSDLRIDGNLPRISTPIDMSPFGGVDTIIRGKTGYASADSQSSLKIEPFKKAAGVLDHFIAWLSGAKAIEQKEEETITEGVYQPSGKPILEAPATTNLVSKEDLMAEMEEFVPNLRSMREEIEECADSLRDPAVFAKILDCIREQRISIEKVSETDKNEIHRIMDKNRALQKEYLEGKNNMDHQKKITNILQWTNGILSLTLTGLAIAGGIMTSGAALLPILTVGASITGGGLTITEGLMKYDTGKKEANLLGMKETREVNNNDVRDLITKLNQAFDLIESLYKAQQIIAQNSHDAALMV